MFIKYLKKSINLLCILTLIFVLTNEKVKVIKYKLKVENYIQKAQSTPDFLIIKDYKLLIKKGNEKEILDSNNVFFMNNSTNNNIFLAGHNNKIVFNRIYDLKLNDTIVLNYDNKTYEYYVYNYKFINIEDKSIFEKSSFFKLTLITCSSNNQRRYIVQCKLKN